MHRKYPAVFLDRDGVLTEEHKRILLPSEVVLIEGAEKCVRRLKSAGFIVIVITNQSGVARGLFSERELANLHKKICKETNVDRIYYCPHHPQGTVMEYTMVCDCRKPKIGMIEQACKEYSIDLTRSWLVGDRESDILTGREAGIKTILVKTGYGEDEIRRGVVADRIEEDLFSASEYIIQHPM